ncbi:MAG: hypothetical protein Q4F23_01215 [Coriobacteriia bacterium]|nr:hypothetical protein [Coriobacteriia bacterium]
MTTTTQRTSAKKAFILISLVALIAGLALTCGAREAHASSVWVCNIKTAKGAMAHSTTQAKRMNLDSSSYTVYPSGDKSGRTDFKALHLVMNKCTTWGQRWDHRNKKITVRLVPGKTYYINQTLKLYNNITFIGTGATLRQVANGKGVFINALYKSSSDNVGSVRKIGGYKRGHNFVIKGGKYVTTGKPGSTSRSKNGWRFGYSTFLFMHCNKIRIKDVTITNNYNGHSIELAGCANTRIERCTFNGTYRGDSTNEVIQLDTTKNSSCSPQGAPWDGTTTRTTLIDRCKFYVTNCPKGVGTNNMSTKGYYRVKVTNSTFKVKKYAVALYKVTRGGATGNKIIRGKVLTVKSPKAVLGKTEKKHRA